MNVYAIALISGSDGLCPAPSRNFVVRAPSSFLRTRVRAIQLQGPLRTWARNLKQDKKNVVMSQEILMNIGERPNLSQKQNRRIQQPRLLKAIGVPGVECLLEAWRV